MKMATQTELLNKMESLLNELSIMHSPKFNTDGPVGTTLDVLTTKELSITQRAIVLYLIFNSNSESTTQRELCEQLGFTMKCVRENLNILLDKDYVQRGPKVYTWDVK